MIASKPRNQLTKKNHSLQVLLPPPPPLTVVVTGSMVAPGGQVVNIGRGVVVVDDDVVVGTEVPPVGQHPCVASKQGVHRNIGGTVQGT